MVPKDAMFCTSAAPVRPPSLDESMAAELRARMPKPPVCDGPPTKVSYRRKLPKLPASYDADSQKPPVESLPNLLSSRPLHQSRAAHEEKPLAEEKPVADESSGAANEKMPVTDEGNTSADEENEERPLAEARSQSRSIRVGKPRKPRVDPFENWLAQRKLKEEEEQRKKEEESELAKSCRRPVVAERFVFRCLPGEEEPPQAKAPEEPARSNSELQQRSPCEDNDQREVHDAPAPLWTAEAFDEMPMEVYELKETMRMHGPRAALKKLQKQRSWEVPDDDYQAAVDVFKSYDINGDGKLSAQEVKDFLKDQGIRCENALEAKKVIEVVSGAGENFIDLDGFVGLIAYDKAERRGYAQETQMVLRKVFDAYDTNHTGYLECPEFSQLLSDLGHVPRTKKESEELAALVYSCRELGVPGPLSFPEFVLLAQRLDQMEVDAESE